MITYLVPVYNSSPYLLDLFDSFDSQTDKNFSILFVDDGSTDDSSSLLASYCSRFSHARVLSLKTNMGIIRALNIGLAACEAEWIARIDADDILHCDRTAYINQAIQNRPDVGIITNDVVTVYRDKLSFKNVKSFFIKPLLFGINPIFHPASAYKRPTALNGFGFYPTDYEHAEDYARWLSLISLKMFHIPLPLTLYRMHEGQITVKHQLSALDCRYKALADFASSKLCFPLFCFYDRLFFRNVFALERFQLRLRRCRRTCHNAIVLFLASFLMRVFFFCFLVVCPVYILFALARSGAE